MNNILKINKDSDLTHILNILKQGYCLWIGSGVTKQLDNKSLSWKELTEKLEKEIVLMEKERGSYPLRLQKVLKEIGNERFNQLLRKNIICKLSTNILQFLEDKTKEEVLRKFSQIAKLGTLANPIVNFNIETITSRVIAGAAHSFSIKSFNIAVEEGNRKLYGSSGDHIKNIFQRYVYHPHGALCSGSCVLTQEQYKTQKDTLAYTLATHMAFQSTLIIVGMSLEDKYLRKQIIKFKNQIKNIYFFSKRKPSKEILKWIEKNNIHNIQLDSWEIFWENIVEKLPEPNKKNLIYNILSIINECLANQNMSGSYSSFIELAKSGKHPFPEEHIKALIESMHRCGETIDNTEPNKFDKTSYYKKLFKKLEIKEECY